MIAVIRVLNSAITFYGWLILGYVLLSWFAARGGTVYEVYRVLATVVEPYVGLFRRIVPTARMGAGGIDFSPLVAWLVLEYVIRRLILIGLIAPALL